MNRSLAKNCGRLLMITACWVLAGALCSTSVAQDKKVTQTAGVDNTSMGAYRALAQLSFQAFKNGDNVTAAELARVLERTWDGAEGGGGDHSLGKTNKDAFDEIDKAMDVFIKPIIRYQAKAPDAAAVEAAYHDYLDKLKQGEQ
jgi:hypothetical protein